MTPSTTPFPTDTLVRMSRALALVLVLALVGCAAAPPEEVSIEALTVCHTTTVEGIDVAEYQGAVDWNMVHASGREFGIARIADGNHIDTTFAANWSGMQAAGMVRGAYYFFRPTLDAQTQAQHISEAVGVLGDGDLPVTIDVECMCPYSTPGHTCVVGGAGCATADQAAIVLEDLVTRVASITGKQPMIYTSARVWDGSQYLASAAMEPSSALWVPGYIHGCVAVASSWSDWQFWQYSDGNCTGCVTGVVPGVSTGADCDRNVWNGTVASLRAFASGDGSLGHDAGVTADAGSDAGTPPDAFFAPPDAHVASDVGPTVAVLRPDGSVGAHVVSSGCGCGVSPTRRPPLSVALSLVLALRRKLRRLVRSAPYPPRATPAPVRALRDEHSCGHAASSNEGRDGRPSRSSRSASTSRSS